MRPTLSGNMDADGLLDGPTGQMARRLKKGQIENNYINIKTIPKRHGAEKQDHEEGRNNYNGPIKNKCALLFPAVNWFG